MPRKTYLNVDLDAFDHNLNFFKEETQKEVFIVLKADAYGLGAKSLVQFSSISGHTTLCVSSIDEALKLRQQGIKQDVLIMGYCDIDDIHYAKRHNLILTVPSLSWAKELINEDVLNLRLHIKVNTRMNRLGLSNLEEVQECLNILRKNHDIEGIFTHYYSHNSKEIETDFLTFKHLVKELDHQFKWIHAASSMPSLLYPETFTNAVRIGIGLYGGIKDDRILTVASLVSHVSMIRTLTNSQHASYEGIKSLDKNQRLALIPVGYADGYLRSNSLNNTVQINDRLYPFAGSICMDQIIVAVDKKVKVGDKVILFGKKPTLFELADKNETIPYEILTSITKRVPRHYLRNKELVATCNDMRG